MLPARYDDDDDNRYANVQYNVNKLTKIFFKYLPAKHL